MDPSQTSGLLKHEVGSSSEEAFKALKVTPLTVETSYSSYSSEEGVRQASVEFAWASFVAAAFTLAVVTWASFKAAMAPCSTEGFNCLHLSTKAILANLRKDSLRQARAVLKAFAKDFAHLVASDSQGSVINSSSDSVVASETVVASATVVVVTAQLAVVFTIVHKDWLPEVSAAVG